MTWLVPLPIVLPLVGAALSILVGRSRAAQRVVGIADPRVARRRLGRAARRGRPRRHARRRSRRLAGAAWASPSSPTGSPRSCSSSPRSTLFAVLVYAIGEPGAERNHVGFQSAYLVLAAGVAASFLTGDLFNLFVAFEMMLTASYVLLTLGGRREQVRAGMTYIVISLLASTLFVTALALLYSATGTVNMADLAQPHRRAPTRRAHGVRGAAARRVRHQGRGVPAVLLAARQLPDRAVADHRGVRRPAHQGRRVRHHPHPAAPVHRRHPAGDPAARRRRGHDGRRRARRHRPGRHPPDPVVHHREPDRLHGHGPRLLHASPASPRSSSR